MTDRRAGRLEGDPPDGAGRRAILEDLETCMLVEAAAGTGKTASMVGRMVELVRRGLSDVSTIAAVTFTRKAAAELRARFQAALEAEVAALESESETPDGERELLAEALANIDACFVGTIHSFCARLLRERPVEAEIDLAFREIEPEEDERLRRRAWQEYTAGLVADDPGGVLDEMARLAMTATELEGAFVRFADFPDVDLWPVPDRSLDLPPAGPVAEAVEAYAEHMRSMGPYPPDPRPPSGGRRLLEEYVRLPWLVRRSDLTDTPSLIDVVEQFDRDAPTMSRDRKKAGWAEFDRVEKERWNGFREEVASPFMRAVMELRYRLVMDAFASARELYDRMRADAGVLNFQDLLMKAAGLLRDRPHVRRYFARRFTRLLVDEFQDTDPIQAQVMLFLTADDAGERDWKKCVPRPGSLFVVGDPKQSIYRFRRADIVTYNDVKTIISRVGRVVELSSNFRSAGRLIDWANQAFRGEFPPVATRESPAYVELVRGRAEPEEGELAGVRVLRVPAALCKEEGDAAGLEYEADLIARFIADALKRGLEITRPGDAGPAPVAPGDFMVIAYNKRALAAYAGALQRYGVAHRVTGGAALAGVRELHLLYACLNAVSQPDNPVALVGVLRSELFGISDAGLYEFKKAGGRFDYNREVPPVLEEGLAAAFADTFERLREYSRLLQRMPPVTAVELIASNLGLPAMAACRPGGDVQAGSVAKAIELMRGAQPDLPTAGDLVEFLGEIIEGAGGSEGFDGVSALPEAGSVVRVMNLHKAKGLQAPVVFLAAHKTSRSGVVDACIDRSEGDRVVGRMGIYRDNENSKTLRAVPEGWEELKEVEKAFEEAEETRLRYVAATRAESMVVVTRKSDGKGRSIWNALGPFVDDRPELSDPGEVSPVVTDARGVTVHEVEEAASAVSGRTAAIAVPSYAVRGARELALSAGGESAPPERGTVSFAPLEGAVPAPDHQGEHGTEWGTAVHRLLELAMRSPGAGLEEFASAALDEAGIDRRHTDLLVRTARSVIESEVWARALSAKRRLSEVPFELVMENAPGADPGARTLVRGAIDLAFEEDGGWVVVDFKTDTPPAAGDFEALASKYAPQLDIYRRAFEECTGERVRQAALSFVRGAALIEVPPAS